MKKIMLITLAVAAFAFTGCGTMNRLLLQPQVTNAPVAVVTAVSNPVVTMSVAPVTNYILLTNSAGAVTTTQITNYVPFLVTNYQAVLLTNIVERPVTNWLERPAVETAITAGGGVLNGFFPGLGGLVTAGLMGAYHIYASVQNKKVNKALTQGVETAREIIQTTPQGQAVDAAFVTWLQKHQTANGVISTVASLAAKGC